MGESITRSDDNMITGTSISCVSSEQETNNDEETQNGTRIIFTSVHNGEVQLEPSTETSVPPEPPIPTSAPQAEEFEIKLVDDSVCGKELEEKEMKNASDDSSEKMCRYCLIGEGDLIAPCNCIGSQKWVHRECLRKWQRSCQVRKSTHPWYRDLSDPERVCNVCVSKFDLEPPKYDEIVHGLTGDQIVAQIREGFMIVATIESSEQSEAVLLVNGHFEELRNHLCPWIRAVYLIIDIYPGLRDDMVAAVNLTQELARPPPYFCDYIRRFRHKKVQIKWMDSGPCDGIHGVGCLRATSREQVEEEMSLRIMDDMPNGLTVAGAFEAVVELCHRDWLMENRLRRRTCKNLQSLPEPPMRVVYACCGDGTWTRSQLIGEIARGSWGMAAFKTNDVFKVPNKPEPPGPGQIYMRLQNENRPVEPQENEMSWAFEEALDPVPFQDTAEARQHREQLRAQVLARSQRSPAPTSAPVLLDKEVERKIDTSAVDIDREESKDNTNLEERQPVVIESEEPPERTYGVDV